MARKIPDPADPCEVVSDDFRKGMEALFFDAAKRWACEHMKFCRNFNLTQGQVAEACGEDPGLFARFLNGERPITVRALVNMHQGFSKLADQHGFDFIAFVPPQDPRHYAVAGWLRTLNEAGQRTKVAVKCRPIGVLHYYCLRFMFASKPWYLVIAGSLPSAHAETVARDILQRAKLERENILPNVLDDYEDEEGGVKKYPLEPTQKSLRDLVQAWKTPWQMAYDCLADEP